MSPDLPGRTRSGINIQRLASRMIRREKSQVSVTGRTTQRKIYDPYQDEIPEMNMNKGEMGLTS